MTDHYDADRRAMARCEADYLREPDRGCDDGCDVCGCALPDDLHICDECAAEMDETVSVDGSEGE